MDFFSNESVKLSTVFEIVKKNGRGYGLYGSCYITRAIVNKRGDIVIVYNKSLIGSKEEQEKCNDSCLLTLKNGFCRLEDWWCPYVDLELLNLGYFANFMFNRLYYKKFLIEVDIPLEKEKF